MTTGSMPTENLVSAAPTFTPRDPSSRRHHRLWRDALLRERRRNCSAQERQRADVPGAGLSSI